MKYKLISVTEHLWFGKQESPIDPVKCVSNGRQQLLFANCWRPLEVDPLPLRNPFCRRVVTFAVV